MMIDWLSFRFRCAHAKPINGGRVVSLNADGSIVWDTPKRLQHAGSYESKISIRSDGHENIDVSGNVVKFFQGHNLFGSDDIVGLVYEMIDYLLDCPEFGLIPSAANVELLATGGVELTRVDITESFDLGSETNVFTYLHTAEKTARMPYHGRGQMTKGSTLYWGKNSRRWSLKMYAKHAEINANIKYQPALSQRPDVIAWSKPILRTELTLRSMELKTRNLNFLYQWSDKSNPIQVYDLLKKPLSEVTMTTTSELSDKDLSNLRSSLRTAYQSWVTGSDLRAILSRPTFYRYRQELLKYGIDISIIRSSDQISNVVPLIRVIELKQAPVPEWAKDTNLFFKPRKVNLR